MNDLNPNIGGMIFINPGTGAVVGANEENAFNNMRVFIADSPIANELYFRRAPRLDYGEGRFAFLVIRNGNYNTVIEVQMPGWKLSDVRYLGENQDPWDFPRLYIDGSSWLWKYAIIDEECYEEYDDE